MAGPETRTRSAYAKTHFCNGRAADHRRFAKAASTPSHHRLPMLERGSVIFRSVAGKGPRGEGRHVAGPSRIMLLAKNERLELGGEDPATRPLMIMRHAQAGIVGRIHDDVARVCALVSAAMIAAAGSKKAEAGNDRRSGPARCASARRRSPAAPRERAHVDAQHPETPMSKPGQPARSGRRPAASPRTGEADHLTSPSSACRKSSDPSAVTAAVSKIMPAPQSDIANGGNTNRASTSPRRRRPQQLNSLAARCVSLAGRDDTIGIREPNTAMIGATRMTASLPEGRRQADRVEIDWPLADRGWRPPERSADRS